MLTKHPKQEFKNNLIDSGIHFMNKDLCYILVEYGKDLVSFNEDFVKFMAQNQYNEKFINLIKDKKKDGNKEDNNSEKDSEDSEENPDELLDRLINCCGFVSHNFEEIPCYVFVTDNYYLKIDGVNGYHMANQEYLSSNKKPQNETVQWYNTTENNFKTVTYHAFIEALEEQQKEKDEQTNNAEDMIKKTPTRLKKSDQFIVQIPQSIETPNLVSMPKSVNMNP